MKNTILILTLALTGCARFSTTQTDTSYDPTGKPQREITTHASTYTFFDSNSKLSSFKASQTDKTQTASVGSIDQGSSGTNVINALQAIDSIISHLPK